MWECALAVRVRPRQYCEIFPTGGPFPSFRVGGGVFAGGPTMKLVRPKPERGCDRAYACARVRVVKITVRRRTARGAYSNHVLRVVPGRYAAILRRTRRVSRDLALYPEGT